MIYKIELQKDECNYLDIARVIGIYLVVLGHFMFTPTYNVIPKIIYTFHMPLFFIVSGILHKKQVTTQHLSFSYYKQLP